MSRPSEMRDALETLLMCADSYIAELRRALAGSPTHSLGLNGADYNEAREIAVIALDEDQPR